MQKTYEYVLPVETWLDLPVKVIKICFLVWASFLDKLFPNDSPWVLLPT